MLELGRITETSKGKAVHSHKNSYRPAFSIGVPWVIAGRRSYMLWSSRGSVSQAPAPNSGYQLMRPSLGTQKDVTLR